MPSRSNIGASSTQSSRFAVERLMNWATLTELLRSAHFRKVFYLTTVVLVAILIVLKYKLFPTFDRKEHAGHRFGRHILDTLIPVLMALIALASVAFWLSGNE